MDVINDLYQQATDYLRHNQFASGGLFLGLFGGVVAMCRHLPGRVMARIWRWISVEVEVTSKDELFEAVEYWLSRSGMLKRSRNFVAKHRIAPPSLSTPSYNYDYDYDCGYGSGGQDWDGDPNTRPARDPKASVEFSPGPGRHWLWRKRRLILLDRVAKEKEKGSEGKTIESFTFHVLSRNLESARELLAEALSACQPADQRITRVYSSASDYWRVCATYRARPADSVILPEGMLENLANDVRRFYSRRDWYRRLGVPYRRGYLLAGKPGNGKTSTIVALAGLFDAPICVLDLSSVLMSDDKLRDLLYSAPQGAFLLFEDIDAVVRNREAQAAAAVDHISADGLPSPLTELGAAASSSRSGVTLSGLLNALDGVASPEGRIVFMSTNYPERLDSALIRPGRVDLRVDFQNADRSQLRRLFLRFHGEDSSEIAALAEEFADLLDGGEVSMATAQGLLLECGDDPRQALIKARELHPKLAKPAPAATIALPKFGFAVAAETNGVCA